MLQIWRALGGGDLQHGRGKAFWRGGDGFNVKLDSSQGRWYDHVINKGGGAIQLVEVALGINRRDAISWLESRGFMLSTRYEEGRVDFHRRRTKASRIAELVIVWRDQRLFELDLQKQIAISESDLEVLAWVARLEFKIKTADALYLLELMRIDQVNDPSGFAQTIHAGDVEKALWQSVIDAVGSPSAKASAK